MEKLIQKLIDDQVNPVIAAHNGSCELVEVKDDIAYLRLLGGCVGCPGRRMTLLNGIKPLIMENVEQIKNVELID